MRNGVEVLNFLMTGTKKDLADLQSECPSSTGAFHELTRIDSWQENDMIEIGPNWAAIGPSDWYNYRYYKILWALGDSFGPICTSPPH